MRRLNKLGKLNSLTKLTSSSDEVFKNIFDLDNISKELKDRATYYYLNYLSRYKIEWVIKGLDGAINLVLGSDHSNNDVFCIKITDYSIKYQNKDGTLYEDLDMSGPSVEIIEDQLNSFIKSRK